VCLHSQHVRIDRRRIRFAARYHLERAQVRARRDQLAEEFVRRMRRATFRHREPPALRVAIVVRPSRAAQVGERPDRRARAHDDVREIDRLPLRTLIDRYRQRQKSHRLRRTVEKPERRRADEADVGGTGCERIFVARQRSGNSLLEPQIRRDPALVRQIARDQLVQPRGNARR
jgi:hypothetical protein